MVRKNIEFWSLSKLLRRLLVATLSLVAVILLLNSVGKLTPSTTGDWRKPVSKHALANEVKSEEPQPQVKAIVICCSDPRLDMIDRIRERYGLKKGEAFPIVVPGGPDPLANPDIMCDECKGIIKHIDLILGKKIPSIDKIVIAEHQNCACIEHHGFLDPDHGKKDFPKIKEFFTKRAPGLKLEMLYYSFLDRERGLVNPIPEVIEVD